MLMPRPSRSRRPYADPFVLCATFLPPHRSGEHLHHPKPGLMVLLPSYEPHMVIPRAGNGPRISISFNLDNEPDPRRREW
jgi:hypothetical protein